MRRPTPRQEYRAALSLGVELLGTHGQASLQQVLASQPALADQLEDRYGMAGLLVAAAVQRIRTTPPALRDAATAQLGQVPLEELLVGDLTAAPAALWQALATLPTRARNELGYGYRRLTGLAGRRAARRELAAALFRLVPGVLPPRPPAGPADQVLVDVSRRIRRSLHPEIAALVRAAVATVDLEDTVQVKVRASGGSCRGLCWDGVPLVSSVTVNLLVPTVRGLPARSRWRRWLRISPSARWLMVLCLPATKRGRRRLPRRRGLTPYTPTAPLLAVRDWREQLYATAAHEAHHLADIQDGRPVDETLAEWHAHHALAARRTAPAGGELAPADLAEVA